MELFAVMMAVATFGVATAYPVRAQVPTTPVKIGFATDMSGLYSDIDGAGGVEAVKMAISDFGGQVAGKKIELLAFDHQNKPDVASTRSRELIDVQKVNLLLGGVNSAVGLAMSKIAAEKKVVYISVGAGTARLTNEECTPYTINYALDTIAQARVAGKAVTNQGGKTWFFLVADYAFGHSLEKDTSEVVRSNGGKVIGSVRHPVSASDFSSYLMQAQGSRAQVLALADAGSDLHNAIKTATEFGINKSMRMTALMQFISDTHAMGLGVTQGMYLSDAWYWDLNDQTRAWSKRFFEKTKKMPTVLQAGAYSATLHYLNAVKSVGATDADKVMAKMKESKVNDIFAKNGYIRSDGRMVHDYYLMEVKKPSESKYPWDYYKVVKTVPGEQAFNTKAESKCSLWK
ncbi:ABC transporter permease [Burkholderia cepacia]|uniref:ABC transporter permease n=3 Tax=Burkholderia cepacia complex TaxID=87882 RepID=A0A1B4Q4B2_BURCE|nr:MULTISPECIES: ABC transporter substrate-binding protein [Burkholderia cepacia complex]AOK21004.1 ABC transporter permease [Burkholderia cepacia]AOK27774.1 ABC transporter permease [Burkholderia ubonensis]